MDRLQCLSHICLLESSQVDEQLGRYTFLAADPLDVFRIEHKCADPLAGLAQRLRSLPNLNSIPGLPPFQGGAMGYLSYDLHQCFEAIPPTTHNEFEYPLAVIGFYDVVFAWDHIMDCGWIISSGISPSMSTTSEKSAEERLEYFWAIAEGRYEHSAKKTHIDPYSIGSAHGLMAEQYETRLSKNWIGNFDSKGLRKAIDKVRDYIAAGDVFQVNIAQRLMRPAICNSLELYLALRQQSPAPFAGYFDAGDFQLVSSSPERFLKVSSDRKVESRPIKGTRPRGKSKVEDDQLRDELLASKKDRAENTMIVDLLRNDLSRVCESNSIQVPQYCEVEQYKQVQHLVSSVCGRMRDGLDVTDLLAATFPGGSITGAPKVRAMEIISELEPTARGPYCGSMGYIGLDGTSDWNILIRTILAKSGWWQLNVGGGIVYDSDSRSEEEETWTKAKGMVAAVDQIATLLAKNQKTT